MPAAPDPASPNVPGPRWRVGADRRTIWVQLGVEPSDHDRLIGLLDTPATAQLACRAVNAYLARRTRA